MYLMIQNKGVAPVEAYTLLGASGSRGREAAIGQFGTGSKQAVTLCLRQNLQVVACCGTERLTFGVRADEFEGEQVQRVTCSVGGRKAKDLGWVLAWGAIDWTETHMALREFVANAIDRSAKDGGWAEAIQSGDLQVGIVDEVRAKGGHTRVFVEVNDEVAKFLEELPRRFLHFSETLSGPGPLLKAGRSLSSSDKAMIYREGVFLRELDDSIYDYNLSAGELEIDECRNSNEYSIKAAIAKRIGTSPAGTLVPIFQALVDGLNVLETSLDPHYLCPSWDTPTDAQQNEFRLAWSRGYGDAVLVDGSGRSAEYVARKGFTPVAVASDGWRLTMQRFGIRSHLSVLSASEQVGRTPAPTTPAAVAALDQVWGWIEAAGMTNGKPRPGVSCFKELTDAEASVMGYQEGDTVYLRDDIASTVNKFTLKVTLEECVHYVTGSGDLTRDFQNFAFDFAVEFLA